MMILEFRPDEVALEPDLQLEPWAQDAAVLEETYFLAPVRFAVGSVDLLGVPGAFSFPWRPLPLLGFASTLRASIRDLVPGHPREIYLAGGGSIRVSNIAGCAAFHATLNGAQATTPVPEYLSAVENFTQRAQQFLINACPRLASHPHWTNWWI